MVVLCVRMKPVNEVGLSNALKDLQRLDESVRVLRKHTGFLKTASDSESSLIDPRNLLSLSTQLKQKTVEFQVPLSALVA